MTALTILIPILLILMMPIILLVMPRFFRKIDLSMRFKLVAIFILLTWCLLGLVLKSKGYVFSYWDICSGALLIISVLIFLFMIWSVLCWGYTISMLLCLSQPKSVTNLHDWEKLYTNTDSLLTLTRNRSQVLVWLGLAKIDKDIVQLTSFGKLFSSMVNAIIRITGIPL